MKHCRECGTEMHESAAACPKCGAAQVDASTSHHSRTVLAVICFFLGSLGIHRFMVGKIGTGILMLLTLGVFGIWTLIDFIMILVGSFRDKEGRVIR